MSIKIQINSLEKLANDAARRYDEIMVKDAVRAKLEEIKKGL